MNYEKVTRDRDYPTPNRAPSPDDCAKKEAEAMYHKTLGAVASGQQTRHPDTPVRRFLDGLKNGQRMFIDRSDFGAVLEALNCGLLCARRGWNGKGMWVGLQNPDLNSKMSRPYIYMRTVDGDLVPWVASQTDLLAHDWELVG